MLDKNHDLPELQNNGLETLDIHKDTHILSAPYGDNSSRDDQTMKK